MHNKKNKINVLILAANFAPSGSVGAKRFSFLSKKLHNKNCNLYILTIKEKYYRHKDYSIPYGGFINRTIMIPPYPIDGNNFFKRMFKSIWLRYLYLLDPYSGWILPSFLKGLSIIRKNEIDVILVTGPPFSHVLSAYLLSQIGRTKFIIDYRDPWTAHPWEGRYTSLFSKKINDLTEKLIIKKANTLVFTTEIMKNNTLKYFKKNISADLHVISNGFQSTRKVKPLLLEENKKVILYAGKFYGDRKLSFLGNALIKLINNNEIDKNSIRFHIFGTLKLKDKEYFRELNLIELIYEHQMVDYHTMLRYMSAADVLLLLSGMNVKYAIPYKFYDYISVKRPILALAPKDSAVENLMIELDCGEICHFNNTHSIETALRNILVLKRNYTFSGIENYHWDSIAQKYEHVLCS